ncbi:hypothetical protein GQ457_12G010520 [Hibiscus cannabinus]
MLLNSSSANNTYIHMAGRENETRTLSNKSAGCEPCRSFGEKCSHLVKKQRAKFYILRRCIAMLVCWRDRGDP